MNAKMTEQKIIKVSGKVKLLGENRPIQLAGHIPYRLPAQKETICFFSRYRTYQPDHLAQVEKVQICNLNL
jgi:hypothetical protein